MELCRVAIPPIRDLRKIFAMLFQPTGQGELSSLKKANQQQISILDLVEADARLLKKRVGIEDREKIDQYFTSIRSLKEANPVSRLVGST